ncbi:hypothetical protein ACIA5G_51860 [Amycolatopsis sp. NPDC051758]|uniref:hypothetical protein n=1 Tax=Amycolatopsis sp. NPDC051758 TaxID=3363935 RepID=UPI0037A2FA13
MANVLVLILWAYASQLRSRRLETRSLATTLSVVGFADLVALILWGWIENKQADWWAAWGQWVGGIGSLAAAATAVWIAQRGWRLATIERREDLASRFSIWVIDTDSPLAPAKAKFVNATQLPVYDVTVDTRGRGILASHRTLMGVLPPTTEPLDLDNLSRIISEQVIGTLKMEFAAGGLYLELPPNPYDSNEWDDPEFSPNARVRNLEIVRERLQVTVSFRLGNQRWTRSHDGHLKAVADA